jgi:hypothetical protein
MIDLDDLPTFLRRPPRVVTLQIPVRDYPRASRKLGTFFALVALAAAVLVVLAW